MLTGRATALVYGASVLIIAGVIIATAVFTLGVRTTYGGGIDRGLGLQVERDFLSDQEAEASALTNSDPSALSRRLTGNALVDVSQQISDQSASSPAPGVSFQPGSLTILRAQDPIDPSLVIEVREDGTKSVTRSAGPNSAPSQLAISFHGNFWLRQDSAGRYLIADQNIQNQASSNLPGLALMAVVLAWIALAAALFQRIHSRSIPTPASSGVAGAVAAVAPAVEAIATAFGPPPPG